MDQKSILDSLVKLEKSLSEISSASEMVKQTTSSYAQVQTEIQKYAYTLDTIASALNELITKIKNGHDFLNNDLVQVVQTKINDIDQLLAPLNQINEVFTTQSNLVLTKFNQTFEEELTLFATKLREQTALINNASNTIQQHSTDILETFKQASSEKLSTLNSDLDLAVQELNVKKTEIVAEINAISTTLQHSIEEKVTAFSCALADMLTNTKDATAKITTNAQSKLENLIDENDKQLTRFKQAYAELFTHLQDLNAHIDQQGQTCVDYLGKIVNERLASFNSALDDFLNQLQTAKLETNLQINLNVEQILKKIAADLSVFAQKFEDLNSILHCFHDSQMQLDLKIQNLSNNILSINDRTQSFLTEFDQKMAAIKADHNALQTKMLVLTIIEIILLPIIFYSLFKLLS